MTELNNHPLNRAAIDRLLQAGGNLTEILHLQPPTLPILQLARLGLEESDDQAESALEVARLTPRRTLARLELELEASELMEGTPMDAAEMVRNILRPGRIRV